LEPSSSKTPGTKRSKKRTYPDMLRRETGLELRELGTAMSDRELWREGYVMFLT